MNSIDDDDNDDALLRDPYGKLKVFLDQNLASFGQQLDDDQVQCEQQIHSTHVQVVKWANSIVEQAQRTEKQITSILKDLSLKNAETVHENNERYNKISKQVTCLWKQKQYKQALVVWKEFAGNFHYRPQVIKDIPILVMKELNLNDYFSYGRQEEQTTTTNGMINVINETKIVKENTNEDTVKRKEELTFGPSSIFYDDDNDKKHNVVLSSRTNDCTERSSSSYLRTTADPFCLRQSSKNDVILSTYPSKRCVSTTPSHQHNKNNNYKHRHRSSSRTSSRTSENKYTCQVNQADMLEIIFDISFDHHARNNHSRFLMAYDKQNILLVVSNNNILDSIDIQSRCVSRLIWESTETIVSLDYSLNRKLFCLFTKQLNLLLYDQRDQGNVVDNISLTLSHPDEQDDDIRELLSGCIYDDFIYYMYRNVSNIVMLAKRSLQTYELDFVPMDLTFLHPEVEQFQHFTVNHDHLILLTRTKQQRTK
ncbi:unnamed protein product, partial [Didymodactylos carnosus]